MGQYEPEKTAYLDTFHAVVYRFKKTIKLYFLVGMKEVCGDAISLEPILSSKKILKESCLLQLATYGRC